MSERIVSSLVPLGIWGLLFVVVMYRAGEQLSRGDWTAAVWLIGAVVVAHRFLSRAEELLGGSE